MKNRKFNLVLLGLLSLVVVMAYVATSAKDLGFNKRKLSGSAITSEATANPAPLNEAWLFTFDSPGTLNESSSPDLSSSPYWWLSSGGLLVIENGIGSTARKTMPLASRWSLAYRINNSLDTDGGRYPQNLFRLVSKDVAGDSDMELSFRLTGLNLTDTPNRDAWSGIFLFSRYQDSDNLYYGGIRQDGQAVIKKKIGGTYYTLGEIEYFKSYQPYQKDTNPNLIPGQKWLQLRLVTKAEQNGLRLTLFLRENGQSNWQELLSVLDNGEGGPAHTAAGRFGIRTDYMDVEFENLRLSPI